MAIFFYSIHEEPYGCFSNFSRHGLTCGGKYWPTSEHYFQAQKFAGTEHEDAVREAPTPRVAAEMGRDRSRPLRSDWEAVKDDVMRCAVRCKFQQNAPLRNILLATGEEELVENAPGDYYWGIGKDGSGRNMLGKVLVEIRAELRREAALSVGSST